jgi:hypothetical protein
MKTKWQRATLFSVTLLFVVASVGSFSPNQARASQNDRDSFSSDVSYWQYPAKKSCKEFYPLPDGYKTWTNCNSKGKSVCGGPQQCACSSNEVLDTYMCSEGTYNVCESDASCR